MYKAIIATLLCGSLGACATAQLNTNEAQIVATVQSVSQTICGYVPLAESITNILAIADPALATASAIANAICKAEAAAQGTTSARLKSARVAGALRAPVPVKVDGVTVNFQ